MSCVDFPIIYRLMEALGLSGISSKNNAVIYNTLKYIWKFFLSKNYWYEM
jgi:hypothetical protein